MENFKLPTENHHDEAFRKFETSKQKQRLLKKYQPKTFWERTAKLAAAAVILTWLFNAISGITESFYIFDLFNKAFANYATLALIVTVVLIIMIELFKRFAAPEVFKNWFLYKKVDYLNLIIFFVFSVISVTLSFKGSSFIPQLTSAPPTLINGDSIAAQYDAMISAKQSEIAAFKKANSWNGSIVNSSRKTYNKLIESKNQLEQEKMTALSSTAQKNDATLTGHSEKVESDGVSLGYVTIICELLSIFFLGFLEFREYNEVVHLGNPTFENQTIKEKPTTTRTIIVSQPAPTNEPQKIAAELPPPTEKRTQIGFRYGQNNDNENRNENRNETKNVENATKNNDNDNSSLRVCENDTCKKPYTYNHKKQKYCSDECRIKHYHARKLG